MTAKRPHALYVLSSIPDDATESVKEALAVRNACTAEGTCPCCGVVGELRPDDDLDQVFHLHFRHEDWCVVLTTENVARRSE